MQKMKIIIEKYSSLFFHYSVTMSELNYDMRLTTWNLTWRHIERFLRPAVPDMNVRRMLPTLLRDVVPSIPTMEPLTIPATGAFTVLNSSLIFCLQSQKKSGIKDESHMQKSKYLKWLKPINITYTNKQLAINYKTIIRSRERNK